jgi:transmembrane sensor
MKEINNTERFTDKEWEELASLLSEEKSESKDLLNRFMAEDDHNVGNKWKELNDMRSEKKINVDKAWNNVHARLKENGLETANEPVRIGYYRANFLRIAAVGLILLSLGFTAVYLNNNDAFSKKISVLTGDDQRNLEVSLPDGSKVVLNRNSEFSYHENFGKHNRNVKLSGEAFFDIKHDDAKPFIIDAGKARVKDVGTSFNVITTNEESAVEVFVKTGKVMLSANSGSKSLILDPGFIGKMDSEKSEKSVNDNPNYLSWNTGHLEYTNQKLAVVFKDLKRVFNMDIFADDPAILENPWHSPIDDNLKQDDIIRMICLSFNLSFTKDGSKYRLSKK